VATAGSDSCKPCGDLQHSTVVKKIEQRADNLTLHTTHTNNEYLTWAQMQCRYGKQRAGRGPERLQRLALQKRLLVVQEKLQLHEAFIMALSEGSVPRLQQLVGVALRNGEGIGSILSRLHAALAGMYSPKGWEVDKELDEESFHLAYLVLRTGGPQLLTALNRQGMLPSVTWVRSHSQQLPRLVSPLTMPGSYGADRSEEELQSVLQQVLISNIEAVVLMVSPWSGQFRRRALHVGHAALCCCVSPQFLCCLPPEVS
jgi:hypothetical protein